MQRGLPTSVCSCCTADIGVSAAEGRLRVQKRSDWFREERVRVQTFIHWTESRLTGVADAELIVGICNEWFAYARLPTGHRRARSSSAGSLLVGASLPSSTEVLQPSWRGLAFSKADYTWRGNLVMNELTPKPPSRTKAGGKRACLHNQ